MGIDLQKLLEDFKSSTKVVQHSQTFSVCLDGFVNDFRDDMVKNRGRIIEALNEIKRSNRFDALFVGSEFLKLFPSNREEDTSDKLAWYLNFSFIKDENKRKHYRSKVISELRKKLRFDHFASETYNRFESIQFDEFSIKREYQFSETGQRIDIILSNNQLDHGIGIEIKISDTYYEKSNSDFNQIRKMFKTSEFWMVLPLEKYKKIFRNKNKNTNASMNNDDDDNGDDIRTGNLSSLIFPMLFWEDICKTLRSIVDDSYLDEDFLEMNVFTNLFIGAIESSVLKIIPKNINNILDSGKKVSLWDIISADNYLFYRRNSGV